MKRTFTLLVLVFALSPVFLHAQLNNGGLYSGFGVDADTRTNYLKYGILTGSISSDDWFAPSGLGYNVIDTTNSAYYKSMLQSSANIAFSQRMSRLLYSKVNNKLWLDAVYGRDYTSAGTAKDSTVFGIAAKNGQDPNTWAGTVSNVPSKNDLVDVYAHMRRDGPTVYDSLWFYTGIVAYGNAAASYYNVELYKQPFGYNSSTRTFNSAGTNGGHTEWTFDAAGRITQTGDMIVAVSFFPGQVPVVEVRIWVSQNTYNSYLGGSLVPEYFNFNSFSTTTGTYGYASIVSKAGTTAFGAGIANYSGTPAQDTTYSTPWGSLSSAAGWEQVYQSEQFIEVGLNLTRIGVDPALYSTLNPCQSFFSNIFFASRSSPSFSANLQDFVGPLTFLRNPVMDFIAQGDTLRCNHPTATINIANQSTVGNYTWKAMNGGAIGGANSDSTQLTITKAGTYIVSGSPATGCPPTRVDTIVIPIDTFPPVATATAGLSGPNLTLFGGDTAKSNYPTPFGGSKGLTWSWTGPGNFSSTIQNPVTDTVWGIYHLTVTEKRNGCTDTASATALASLFIVLQTESVQLRGNYTGKSVDLSWQDATAQAGTLYTIERSNGNSGFLPIGTTAGFSFSDDQPLKGNNLYRLKVAAAAGNTFYSPVIAVGVGDSPLLAAWLASDAQQAPTLLARCTQDKTALLVEYDLNGRPMVHRAITLAAGMNTIQLADIPKAATRIVALYMNGTVVWCQKAFY